MNVLTIIILVIAAVCICLGCMRGLFRTLLVVGATIAAMVLSSYACPYVSKFIQKNTNIEEKIEVAIVERLSLDVSEQSGTKFEQMQMIEDLPCPEALKLAIVNNNNADIYTGLNVTGFQAYLASYLSSITINCLAYVIVMLAITVLFYVLIHISNALKEIPIIGAIDKVGGILLGSVQALGIIWSFFILISFIGNTELGIAAFTQISESPVLNFLYENNMLMNVITNISNVLFLS
ncbi:MAG: CvpA family protein [Lachnospiraceae bacterium]|nr:CvpA family protein [Lachnospiraceae bacterium]